MSTDRDATRERTGSRPATTLDRGVLALAHPMSIGAIVVLVINDHVLKHANPSWWTGKLSDFAGLLFFPLLLTTILAGVGWLIGFDRPIMNRSDRLTAGCFALTAALFYGLKMVDPINRLAVEVLRLLGIPNTVIVRDATDLLALLSLLPAWWIWRSTISAPTGRIRASPRVG